LRNRRHHPPYVSADDADHSASWQIRLKSRKFPEK
jgi:hypothetical protein